MRLSRLILGRYGHLSDVEMAFPPDRGLHIVMGANEAGKSTALAAIGDCLFGFPHKTPFAFLHAPRDLRIGATLSAADGRESTFFRRKSRKDALLDEQDRALPESAIAAFLSGATRERFDRVFGLNGIELRLGGDSILKGEGEVGEQIVSAHTGLHGFRALVARLDGDAGRLFGDKRGKREFHEAADRYRQARDRVAERKIEPAAYKQAQDELEKLNQIREANAVKALTLHAERSRLDRIRRTTPARLALASAAASRAELGDVPDLPADAATRFQDAVGRRDQAIHDLTREQGRVAELEAEVKALPATSPVLAQAESIDALADHRQRIVGAERDRADQRLLAAQCETTISEAGRELGLSLDALAVVDLIPTTLDREKVNQALRRHERLLGQGTQAADDLAGVEAKLLEAKAALDELPETEPFIDLRQAIETVRAEGRLHADLVEAEAAHRLAMDECGQALRSLPLWDRDAGALAAAPVPLDAIIQRHADALKSGQDAVLAATGRVAEHDRALRDFAAEALADTARGDLPTIETIQAARVRRDRAWSLIKRHHVDGGPAPSAIELSELATGDDLAGTFDTLLQAADVLSDRRATERERVVAVEQRRRDQLRRQALRDADALEHAAAVTALEQALSAWRGLWQPLGVDPAEPAAMREWLQKRATVLAEQKRVQEAERRVMALRQRHQAAFAVLASLLPAEAEAAAGNLSALLRSAERVCVQRERQADRSGKARDALDLAQADQTKARRSLARVEEDLVAWHAGWDVTAALLSLPAGSPTELAPTALAIWNEIDQASRRCREAFHRIEEMTATIERFSADTAAVVGCVAADLAGVAPHDAVVELAASLADARQAARRRAEVEAELMRLRAEVRRHQQDRDTAEHRLAGLRTVAGVTDDTSLNDAIIRCAKHRALSDQIAGRESELHRLDDGKALAELAEEADGVDFDTLAARIFAIEADLTAINSEELTNQARITELKQALAAMEQGHNAAEAAQDMETALADIDDIAERYVTVRLAHVLLRAGIERFRRQQQDPLLGRAGQIFTRLTEGRYDRLGVDEDDGKMLIKACRPDGTECQADRLSEGTLDQLYLALRLAAIESYARTTEPLPFIADDLLVNFDDRRAKAAIRVLADFGKVTQVILFTHHNHIADMAQGGAASVHSLQAGLAAV